MASPASPDTDEMVTPEKARALLTELRARGIRVEPSSRGTILISPRRLIDEETVERIVAAKPQLLEFLSLTPRTWSCSRCTRYSFGKPKMVCFWCRKTEERPGHA